MEDENIIIEYTNDEEVNLQQQQAAEEAEKAEERKKILDAILLENEDSQTEETSFMEGLRQLGWPWFFRYVLPMLLLLVVGFLLVITCRYRTQQAIIEKDQLIEEREKWHDLMLTQQSVLTEQYRQSHIEALLKQYGDSTLKMGTETPYTINISE